MSEDFNGVEPKVAMADDGQTDIVVGVDTPVPLAEVGCEFWRLTHPSGNFALPLMDCRDICEGIDPSWILA